MANAILMDQSGDAALAVLAGSYVVFLIIGLVVSVLMIVAQWKLFTKAGEEGWKSLIPIYNGYVMFQIVYGQGWKYFLTLVPVLNYVVLIAYYVRLAQVYGKSVVFGILNLFFAPITMLILAFGDADYQGPIDSFL
ncbi:MAG: hypothetical protein E7504_00505 [Ruminococcus sp.]|nr:hypothetical protein [Ruminococcus sp.]